MADGGPHWHPEQIARLTYAQVVLFCQDRTELVQRLKAKRKHGDEKRVKQYSMVDGGIPVELRGKIKTMPNGMSLAAYVADEQAKGKRDAKRRRRKRRKNRGR